MCVDMFLRICTIVTSLRLKLYLGEGGNFEMRYVTQGGDKSERYVSLHRGVGGSKMTEISVT